MCGRNRYEESKLSVLFLVELLTSTFFPQMTKFSQNIERLQSVISAADEQHKKEASVVFTTLNTS